MTHSRFWPRFWFNGHVKPSFIFAGVTVAWGLVAWPSAAMANKLDAQTVYNKSVHFFSQDNLSFIVQSTIENANGSTQQRRFLLAKHNPNAHESAVLIRFAAPDDIKCTAVLIQKQAQDTQRYAYFPALNRTRIIPESDKNKEIFGIGISYEELNKPKGDFEPLAQITRLNKPFYNVTVKSANGYSVYWIEAENFNLDSIEVYQQNTLQKKVTILTTAQVFGEKLITAWNVHEPASERVIHYTIDSASISNEVDSGLFHKNRLSRCLY